MKQYARNDFRISRSRFEIKLAYTGFLLLTLVGYASFGMMVGTRIGPGPADIATHYRGSEAEEIFPVTTGQLIEGLHLHAFIMALVLLVLTHITVATGLPRRLKSGVILLAYGSALTNLAAPWLIRFVAGGFAWLLLVSWVGMWMSALVMVGGPLWEMWGRPPSGDRPSLSPDDPPRGIGEDRARGA
jgi:hypothetical protein